MIYPNKAGYVSRNNALCNWKGKKTENNCLGLGNKEVSPLGYKKWTVRPDPLNEVRSKGWLTFKGYFQFVLRLYRLQALYFILSRKHLFPYLNISLDGYNNLALPSNSSYKRADHHPDHFQDCFDNFYGIFKLILDFLIQGTAVKSCHERV